jgi:hypothetical protein
VKAAHFEAGIGRNPTDIGALRCRHAPGVVAESKRRELEAAIAKARRQRALTFEGKLADHFIAERKLHQCSFNSKVDPQLDGFQVLRQCARMCDCA